MLKRPRIEERLAAEAEAARVPPPPRLRASTLAALRSASRADAAPRRRPLPAALAAVLVAAATTAAAIRFLPVSPGGPAAPTGAGAQVPDLALLRIDATIRGLRGLATPGPDPLRTEALLVLADARQARDFLLARLPGAVPWGTNPSVP